VIQLKILSCVRVGSETKKISINIPDFGLFIHQVYTNVARKLYSTIYLFEVDIPDLEVQKRNREFELLVQTCLMNTIRDKIPVELLLRQYMDETQEVEVKKVETVVEQKVEPALSPSAPPAAPPSVQPALPQASTDSQVLSPILSQAPAPQLLHPVLPQVSSEIKPVSSSSQNIPENIVMPEKQGISFSQQLESFDNGPNYDLEEETLKFGEVIPINTLSFDDLDSKNDSIDLGIIEL
jgi:hypothetical protein